MPATTSPTMHYDLPGDAAHQATLYPPPEVITDKSLNLTSQMAVIAHYTASSLNQDGIEITTEKPVVMKINGTRQYRISFTAKPGFEKAAQQFAKMHVTLLDAKPAANKQIICVNSQLDLFFDVKKLQPMYSWAEAEQRCSTMSDGTYEPRTGSCAPQQPLA